MKHTKKLDNLISKLDKKLSEAQQVKDELLDYLEYRYGIDTAEYIDYIDNENDWCYGVCVDSIEKLINERMNK